MYNVKTYIKYFASSGNVPFKNNFVIKINFF